MKEVSDTFVRLREAIGDRYTIERELGRGGMATVFLARDQKHDREVAIKVLHPELSASIGAERFEREIKLAAKLQHPHILGLYDSGVADGLMYYVMPFVKGESLRDRLDRESMLPLDDALRITLEVCGALQHAHDQGIVHRDIKPENILLSGDHALVADFGIARAASEAGQQKLTQTGMAVGTPVYMAPEQSTGDTVGPTADIYSLGCMLYEMLAGEPPFTGANAMAIMAKHLMEQVPSVRVTRSAVPEEVEQAIFFALAKTPVDRPQTAQAFAEVLGMPLGATATMRAMRGSIAMRRTPTPSMYSMQAMVEPVPFWKRPAVLAATAVLLIAGIGGGYALTRGGGAGAAALGPNASRVAVLYFEDKSRDSSLTAVADGISEGLIRTFSRTPSFTVISRSGVEPYRGSALSVDSIARALRVGYLVRGEVEEDGGRVRVSVRLDDATGTNIDRTSLAVPRDSLLLLQDSIATVAANLIGAQLRADIKVQSARVATASEGAWLATQRGAQLQKLADARRAAGESAAADSLFTAADSAFATAERLDPRWSSPPAQRAALAYRRSRLVGRNPLAIRPWVALGVEHANRSLALDPQDADALETRGNLRYWGYLTEIDTDRDARQAALLQAEKDLERATEINGNQAGAFATLSHLYYQLPDKTTNDVYVAAREALRADEFQSNVVLLYSRLFNASYDLEQIGPADDYCRNLESRNHADPRAVRCRLYLQSAPGLARYDIARARRLADSLVLVSAPADSLLARYTANMFVAATLARATAESPARADSARRLIQQSLGNATLDKPRDLAFFGAFASTLLGDKDEAIRLIGTYLAANPPERRQALAKDPGWWFRPIKDTPEWKRVVGSM
ncbi:MAG: serine/threonine-protein kinase [Gemmatimonadota bacterium]|nr:serine/threonine-protein kinase [Gemmatimonadota bacterium]